MENTCATERLNNSIIILRNDLIEMRIHDIKLMKQLLNINVTIQKITNERLGQYVRLSSQSSRRGSTKRQNSASPSMWLQSDIVSSSNTEDNGLSDYVSDFSDIEDDIFSKSNPCNFRTNIISIQPLSEEDIEDSSDEEILRTNIKLWKYAKSYDSGSMKGTFNIE